MTDQAASSPLVGCCLGKASDIVVRTHAVTRLHAYRYPMFDPQDPPVVHPPDDAHADEPEPKEMRGPDRAPELSSVSEKLDRVLEQLSTSANVATRKDRLDKFQLFATVFIAFFAMLFSFLGSRRDAIQREAFHVRESAQRDSAQAQNVKVQELQIIIAFLPHLTGSDEKKKEYAVRLVRHLTTVELASIFAEIEPSPGTAAGLNTIKRAPDLSPRERARIDTALNRFPPVTRDILEILDVPGGGIRSDTVFRTDTVLSAPSPSATPGGTAICGLWEDAYGNYYCSGPCLPNQACGRISVEVT